MAKITGEVSIIATNFYGLTKTITYRLLSDGRLQKRVTGDKRWRPLFRGERVTSPWPEVRRALIRNVMAHMQLRTVDGKEINPITVEPLP